MSRKRTSEIDVQDVLRLICPTTKKMRQTGEMSIACPLHPGNSFDLNVHSGGFRCWKSCPDCPVGGKGKTVKLYMLFNPSLSYEEAVEAICAEKTAPAAHAAPSAPAYVIPEPVKNSEMAPIEVRDKTYRALLKMLPLTDAHRQEFRKRGMTDAQIEELRPRSIPMCGVHSIPQNLLEMGCTLEGVPLFGKENGEWALSTTKGKTGCFVPYYDRMGRIQQLQIRFDIKPRPEMTDKELKELKKARYRWGTSAHMTDGCSAKNVTFWGVEHAAEKFKAEKTVYVTEGGIKASVASALSGRWYIGTTSVSCHEQFAEIVRWCKKTGKRMVDCYDMDGKITNEESIVPMDSFIRDKASYPQEIVRQMETSSNPILVKNKDGKLRVVNGNVHKSIQAMHQIAKDLGVEFHDWFWDPEYKGVDDHLFMQSRCGGSLDWDGEICADDSDNDVAMPAFINGRVNKALLPKVI